jgi:hypothetical protein
MSMPDDLDPFRNRFCATWSVALPGWIISLTPPVEPHAALAPAASPRWWGWLLRTESTA